jgi:hypothetical protein
MANPTSNFGWQMPTPTDLVTDLPADFEVFGQAVDTSLADLKGGTTGQVLAKNSGTDMDFVWVATAGDIEGVTAGTGISGGGTSGTVTITNSMATEIDAKGDLIAGTGADAFSRLAAGANGTVLKANSSTATGLEWGSVSVNPSYTLVATSSPNGTSALTFSSLSGYSDYFIVMYPATVGVGALRMTINSDTGSNYVYTLSSTGLTQSSTADTAIRFGYAGSNSTTFYGGIEIGGANASGNKVIKSISGGGSGADNAVTWGYWKGTGTITSITITTGNTFNANAFFHLLGA